jgi:PPOX class probable F420-dependent enzyme
VYAPGFDDERIAPSTEPFFVAFTVEDVEEARSEIAAAGAGVGAVVWAKEAFGNPDLEDYGWFFVRAPDNRTYVIQQVPESTEQGHHRHRCASGRAGPRPVSTMGPTRQGACAPGIPDSYLDLLSAPIATLATVGSGGRPQLPSVCFLATADGTVQLSVNATRQKAKNMLATGKVALHIEDPGDWARYLEVRGDATVEPDEDYVFADLLGAKYDGMDLRKMDRPGEHRTVGTIHPTRIRAVDMHRPGEVGSSLQR